MMNGIKNRVLLLQTDPPTWNTSFISSSSSSTAAFLLLAETRRERRVDLCPAGTHSDTDVKMDGGEWMDDRWMNG